ncbi:MAG: TlpA family protein disulfide reductase [Chloroflexi bacterium]|nr:TlpA family protein disulfide reductase [Chloroflexota bacterium]
MTYVSVFLVLLTLLLGGCLRGGPRPPRGLVAAPVPTPEALALPTPAGPAQSYIPPLGPGEGTEVGQQVPDVKLILLDGSVISLKDLRGKGVVLNFWASWCAPCRKEMPDLEQVWREYKGRGVMIIGIAVADREASAREFAEKIGVSYPISVDSTDQVSALFAVKLLPTTLFIDSRGTIVRRQVGLLNLGTLRIFIEGILPP